MSPSKTALRVADLVAGAQVLDDLVRVQHVVAHLVAPAGLHVAAHARRGGPSPRPSCGPAAWP